MASSFHRLVLLLVCVGHTNGRTNTNQTQAQDALDEFNKAFSAYKNLRETIEWINEINLTSTSDAEIVRLANSSIPAFWRLYTTEDTTNTFNITHFPTRMKRQFEIMRKIINLQESFGSRSQQTGLMAIYEQIQPLYKHLHAYVRKELMKINREEQFPDTRQIPIRFLDILAMNWHKHNSPGEEMGMRWDTLLGDLVPFKNKPSMNFTDEMIKQNYNYLTMYQTADRFIGSLGLTMMPGGFWNKSFLHDNNDGRKRICSGTAWNFYNKDDFRIKMCTKVNMKDLETVYSLMGVMEQYIQTQDQPAIFRTLVHPSMGTAIGDSLSLSALSPQHLHQIGLMPDFEDNYENDINYLMKIALRRIPSMQLSFLITQWQWSDTIQDQHNEDLWKLRCKHQGTSPPRDRSSSSPFDHTDPNYLYDFISDILMFQIHEALCEKSGHTGPLHKCNIYNSKDAGKALGDMMKLGSSVDGSVALDMLTGQTTLNVQPMLDYFGPLLDFLQDENENEIIEWNENCPT